MDSFQRTTAEAKRLNRTSYSSKYGQFNEDSDFSVMHTWTPKDDEGYLGEDIYLWVYSGIVVALFVLTKWRAIYFFMFCIKISINVHNKMFTSLVRAPIKFFDDNPSGLNNFLYFVSVN